MGNQDQIQFFGEKRIRTAWNDVEEKWYFSIIDIIEALVETDRPRKYWADLKKKLATTLGMEDGGPNEWLEPVTDEQYSSVK